jgi:hypothetical protein
VQVDEGIKRMQYRRMMHFQALNNKSTSTFALGISEALKSAFKYFPSSSGI